MKTIMKKRWRFLLWLAILIGFNYFLFLVYIQPAMDQWRVNNNDQIIATWWGQPQTGLETKEIVIKRAQGWDLNVRVEVAKTSEQRRVWLMYRAQVPDNHGMLFVFEDEKELSFWMQNTYIGLDLLYVSSDGIIKHIHNDAKPLDLTGLPSIVPVQYVIEVNDQFVEKYGIQVGDMVIFNL